MKFGGHIRIVFSTVAWCAMFAYLVFAVRMCRGGQEAILLWTVEIRIADAENIPIVDRPTVEGWLKEYALLRDSMPLNRANTGEIKRFLEDKPFVRRADVYTDMEGKLTVELWQRRPIARFALRNGYDFYVSDDMYVMPAGPGGSIDVPLVTGSFRLPFEQGYAGKLAGAEARSVNFSEESCLYFGKLINFVRLIGSSSFWDAQIVQINVEGGGSASYLSAGKEPEIELIPRVGRHLILFGNLEDTQEKLDKLMLFYDRVLDYEGWEQYRTVNLKYKDQIVCTRR